MTEGVLGTAIDVGERLDAAGIPYAIGGALALGVHGVSRATNDVDLNVFVELPRLDAVFDVLEASGVAVDRAALRVEAERDGVFFCWRGPIRIDVFLPSIDLSWEALKTRTVVPIDARSAWFFSAEMLACFKLLFFRPKDLLDLERLVGAAQSLDVARVRALIAEAMGDDDERVRAWDDIVRRFRVA